MWSTLRGSASGVLILVTLAGCSDRATDLDCSQVVSMRTEVGSSPGAESPDEAASSAGTGAADFDAAPADDDDPTRKVYAYDEEDNLVAIVQVEETPRGGWVATGVDRCSE